MPAQCTNTTIASYDDYIAIYFPQRAASALLHVANPGEMGVQLALESLEKHCEILCETVQDVDAAEE